MTVPIPAILVIDTHEQTPYTFESCTSDHSRANPKSIIASLIAFSQRYGIHVIFAGDRRHAEAYTYRLCERWVRDKCEAQREQVKEDAA